MDPVNEPIHTGRSTILLVDDHDIIRGMIRDWLRGIFVDCGFVEVQSGEDAVRLVANVPVDLVLMDVGLPHMNGLEATRHITSIAPQAQVVVLTIRDDIQYQLDAKAAGASALISKYEMAIELVPTMIRLLRQGSTTVVS